VCAINAKEASLRDGLSDALTGLAAESAAHSEVAGAINVAEKNLRHARRAAHEAARVKDDDAAAWLRLAQSQLELSKLDAPSAAYHKSEAKEAWQKVVELERSGILRPVPTPSAVGKEQLMRQLWQVEDQFKMDAKKFLDLGLELSAKQ
jgi:hypothetical protein